jgi:ribosomal protein S6--L-glutamate ligase
VGVPGGWSSERLADAFARRTGTRRLVDMERVVLDLDSGACLHEGEDLRDLDGLVMKKLGSAYSPEMLDRLETLRYLAGEGVRVYSRPECVERLIDRMSGTVTLRQAGVPMPPTVITEDAKAAAEAVRRFGRAVLKPLYSTKAHGMRVVDASNGDLEAVIRDFRGDGNRVLYVQKVIDLPDRDLGVAFLGGQHVGTYARVRSGGSWNTTVHAGGHYSPHEPTAKVVELAHRAQAEFNLDFTTVDVAEVGGEIFVFEVSAFGGFRGLLEGPGIDIAERLVEYVLEDLRRG